MKKQLWVRFLAALLAAILLSQPVWGMADAWGGAEGAEGDAVEITEDVFPDAHFRRYIEKELDQDQDGQLSQSEREAVESRLSERAGDRMSGRDRVFLGAGLSGL